MFEVHLHTRANGRDILISIHATRAKAEKTIKDAAAAGVVNSGADQWLPMNMIKLMFIIET